MACRQWPASVDCSGSSGHTHSVASLFIVCLPAAWEAPWLSALRSTLAWTVLPPSMAPQTHAFARCARLEGLPDEPCRHKLMCRAQLICVRYAFCR